MEPIEQATTTVLPSVPMYDVALAQAVRETFASHCRLSGLDIDLAVKGGVAHVRGAVPSEDDRHLVRKVLGRVRGIKGIWDVIATPENRSLRVVEIGCGRKKEIPWSIGVDRQPYEGVDVVADLEKKLPFNSGEIDYIFAVHILEHIRDLVGLMNEMHRILKPGGVAHILSPNAGCVNAVADPTHVRLFNRQSFKYFCRPQPGLAAFRPLCVSSDHWNVYADLSPVQPDEVFPSEAEVAFFFGEQ